MEEIKKAVQAVCNNLFKVDIDVELTRPDEQFGDYATNVALQLAKQLNKNSRDLGEKIVQKLQHPDILKAETAGPGFINIYLTDKALWKLAEVEPAKTLKGQVIVAEYSDPNPFKVLHAGHVYTTVVGEAIAQLLEFAGATVHRVNFGGDVGLHVGKTMWSILGELGGENPEKLKSIKLIERSSWLSSHYVAGNAAYETDENAQKEIMEYNKRVYNLQKDNDHESAFAKIYWTCRKWSYEAFDKFYARFGAKLEKYYPESEVADLGLKKVQEYIGKVFEKSEGAVIFKGEKYGLHTRVFITKEGLPTYEAKDVGLIIKKHKDYHFDKSVVITDNEQQPYMGVVLKAIEQFLPNLVKASTYIPHGKLKLAGNIKMSSRIGNIVPASEVLDITATANKKIHGSADDEVVLAAVKYAFSKQRIGQDIIYDPKESVSIEGNSGPYLQYAHARACSILKKSQISNLKSQTQELEDGERSLLRKIDEYSEVVNQAVIELMPHHICTYLYELAQTFNSFYEHNRVIGDKREAVRLGLVKKYAETLKKGLNLLNIEAPEKM